MTYDCDVNKYVVNMLRLYLLRTRAKACETTALLDSQSANWLKNRMAWVIHVLATYGRLVGILGLDTIAVLAWWLLVTFNPRHTGPKQKYASISLCKQLPGLILVNVTQSKRLGRILRMSWILRWSGFSKPDWISVFWSARTLHFSRVLWVSQRTYDLVLNIITVLDNGIFNRCLWLLQRTSDVVLSRICALDV